MPFDPALESLVHPETLAYIKERAPEALPETVVVLGSGVSLWPDLEAAVSFDYGELPHFPESTVVGHSGRLTFGKLFGHRVAVVRGRFHRYEGYDWEQVVYPISTLAALGAKRFVLTNAAGGLNTTFAQGDLMLIQDHLNLHPWDAKELQHLAARAGKLAYLNRAYSSELQAQARKAAAAKNVFIREGVYLGLLGPSYETPAEIRAFRRLGADAVGMSTVPESIWATALGADVVAFSVITNVTHSVADLEATSHQEVIDVAKTGSERLEAILTALVGEWSGQYPLR